MTMTARPWARLGAALLAATLAAPLSAQEVTLRLHQFLPAQSGVPANILTAWADAVEADSDGRIVVERYPAMQLGGTPPDLIDQVIDGVADVVWTLPGYTPGRFPRVEVFELPFLSPDAEATSRAFWQLAEDRMMDTDFADVHVLALWVHGPGVIHSDRPIADVADLRGVQLRAPTRTVTTLLTSLGASAVGMPVPAIPEALARGVIDGAVIPWEVTTSLRMSELVDNHTEFTGNAFYTAAFVLAMNKEVYDGLPDDLRQVIDDNSGLEFSAFAGRTQQGLDAGARQIAVDRGNTIVTLDAEAAADWQAASQPTIDAWVAEADAAGIDGTGLLEDARRLIEENAAE